MKTLRELDVIRGKMISGNATIEEIQSFLVYVTKLEELVEEASNEDFYGTQGWTYRVFGE